MFTNRGLLHSCKLKHYRYTIFLVHLNFLESNNTRAVFMKLGEGPRPFLLRFWTTFSTLNTCYCNYPIEPPQENIHVSSETQIVNLGLRQLKGHDCNQFVYIRIISCTNPLVFPYLKWIKRRWVFGMLENGIPQGTQNFGILPSRRIIRRIIHLRRGIRVWKWDGFSFWANNLPGHPFLV